MDLYMYSLTLNTQEYEELTSQLFLYKIITKSLLPICYYLTDYH